VWSLFLADEKRGGRIALSGQSIDRRASQTAATRDMKLEVWSPAISDSLTLAAIGKLWF